MNSNKNNISGKQAAILAVLAAFAALFAYLITYQPNDSELFRTALYRQVVSPNIERDFFASNGVTTFNAEINSDFSDMAQPATKGIYEVTNTDGRGIKNDFITDSATSAIKVTDFSVGAGEPNPAALDEWFYIKDNGKVVGDEQGTFAYVEFINSPLSELPGGDLSSDIRNQVFGLLEEAYVIQSSERSELDGQEAVKYSIDINEELLLEANTIIAEAYGLQNIYAGSPQSFSYDQFEMWVGVDSQTFEQLDVVQFGQASTISINYENNTVKVPAQDITYDEFVELIFAPAENQASPDA